MTRWHDSVLPRAWTIRATCYVSFIRRALDIHLILDNYGMHKTQAIRRWLASHPRFHVHFIPTGASWLNLVERWFGVLSQKGIRRGSFVSTRGLEQAIEEYLQLNNKQPKPFGLRLRTRFLKGSRAL